MHTDSIKNSDVICLFMSLTLSCAIHVTAIPSWIILSLSSIGLLSLSSSIMLNVRETSLALALLAENVMFPATAHDSLIS